MNFDDDEDSEFSFNPQSTNKLASLFKATSEENSDETLKYKASKQPIQSQAPQSGSQQTSSVIFFSAVQAFKFLNNQYSPQGKLGMAVLSNPANTQAIYRILLYVTKTQPMATIRITHDFKISLQKNNYVSFYDDSRQVWSILFDTEDLVANFSKQITLCKCNLLNGNLQNDKLVQDLRFNDSGSENIVENNDSIEVSTIVSSWQGFKLNEIENTTQKPFRLKLGKNKLPDVIETLVVKMRQGDRRLFVLNGDLFKTVYSKNSNSPIFYDIYILRIKKNKEERSSSNADILDQMPPIAIGESESRSRSESIKEKSKIINDQFNEPKLEKAKVISRMAKLGQQMIPDSQNQPKAQPTDDWDNSKASDSSQTDYKAKYQENLLNQSDNESMMQDNQAAQQALLLQKTLQQQLLQNQLAQVQNQQNQLALFKNPINNSSLFNLIDPNAAQVNMMNQPLQQTVTPNSQEASSLSAKLELISEKLDNLKQLSQSNQTSMPNMETQVVLHNIQRIVKENEQYKQELYEKSAKIEEQNSKITDLLLKAQNYVEQSHQYLELKNSSIQNSSEKNQNKILELEQDKMRLTSELTNLTSQISELNLEINKIKKEDLELKQKLNDVSKNTDQYKQNSDRLLVENADLQTKLDTLGLELKKERQLRKTHETKTELNEEEITELKSSLTQVQKLLDEKKKKFESDRSLFDQEMDELKKSHASEINQLKDKLLRARNNLNDLQKEQIRQVEEDLNREWESKMEKIIQQNETKFNRKISDLSEENSLLKKQLNEANGVLKAARSQNSSKESETEQLIQENEDLKVYKERYQRLQGQALAMKDRYESRIKELLEAEPESEIVAEEVKKLMNIMYKIIKLQIKPDQFYSGNGILIAMLKIIKMVTLQLLDSKTEYQFDEENDFFSQYVYVPEPVITKQETLVVKEERKLVQEAETFEVAENKTIENESQPMDQQQDSHSLSVLTSETTLEPENRVNSENNEIEENEKISDEKSYTQTGQKTEEIEANDEKSSTQTTQKTETIEANDQMELEEQENENNKSNENFEIDLNKEERVDQELIDEKNDELDDSQFVHEQKDEDIKSQVVSNNKLFDDSDEDESIFGSKQSETKLFETASESPQVEQTIEDKNKNETPSKNLAAAPASFKFSPPPLFNDYEKDKDIDWFK